ncbi:MAG: hypothetical protein KUF74_18600 [Candidatus Thiodiazotropha sp. (ex Ctena orbiculata)]|nr:hypothetical protein [Candidatus Thiodiazotropha taylori]MCG8025906.1 hypothetical protein [Candidatus Thiodiazotropha endolucinida]
MANQDNILDGGYEAAERRLAAKKQDHYFKVGVLLSLCAILVAIIGVTDLVA